jgi:hypothetical protein
MARRLGKQTNIAALKQCFDESLRRSQLLMIMFPVDDYVFYQPEPIAVQLAPPTNQIEFVLCPYSRPKLVTIIHTTPKKVCTRS